MEHGGTLASLCERKGNHSEDDPSVASEKKPLTSCPLEHSGTLASLCERKGNRSDDNTSVACDKKTLTSRRFQAPHQREGDTSSLHAPEASARPLFKNRRLSMSDAPKSSKAAAMNRLFDLGRGTRGGDQAKALGCCHHCGHHGLFRCAFGKKCVNPETGGENQDPADGFGKPILSFKGGSAWKCLELDRNNLHLDVFWPSKREIPFIQDTFPVEEMAPLCNFRQLKFLKITGMMQSYQKYIWQTVWLNPGLEELALEMALEPCIRRSFNVAWPLIKGDWVARTAAEAHGSYYGDNGQGILHRQVGVGEYLDKCAIEQAKEKASTMGGSLGQLPVVKLSLTGFVVDSDPFFVWFNPHRLRVIEFKNDCVDAGFALPTTLADHVAIKFPKRVIEQAMIVRRVRPGEVKLVDIRPPKATAQKNDASKDEKEQEAVAQDVKTEEKADTMTETATETTTSKQHKRSKRPGRHGRYGRFSGQNVLGREPPKLAD